MPVENIKDKIEGNECDLSLSDLTVVPVKELAAIPKATRLDLSCNILTSLPDEFCQLTHLVRLDLSKNALSKLPENFGALQKLQYVDLFSNKLTTLPVSFHRLKNLRWLDVKDNQLTDPLKSIVGDCLDDVQCKQCAKTVVSFMKQVEEERQKLALQRQQEEKEKAARLKAETDRINRERKEQKKADKERRRKEYEAKMARQKREEKQKEKEKESDTESKPDKEPSKNFKAMEIRKERGGVGCCGVLIAALVGAVALFIGFYMYCQQYADEEICRRAAFQVKKYQYYANKYVEKYFPRNY